MVMRSTQMYPNSVSQLQQPNRYNKETVPDFLQLRKIIRKVNKRNILNGLFVFTYPVTRNQLINLIKVAEYNDKRSIGSDL